MINKRNRPLNPGRGKQNSLPVLHATARRRLGAPHADATPQWSSFVTRGYEPKYFPVHGVGEVEPSDFSQPLVGRPRLGISK
jgi:hypothetical protein